MATLDWSQCPAVESIPGKASGAWVLKGTRMPVSAIFENLEAGARATFTHPHVYSNPILRISAPNRGSERIASHFGSTFRNVRRTSRSS